MLVVSTMLHGSALKPHVDCALTPVCSKIGFNFLFPIQHISPRHCNHLIVHWPSSYALVVTPFSDALKVTLKIWNMSKIEKLN